MLKQPRLANVAFALLSLSLLSYGSASFGSSSYNDYTYKDRARYKGEVVSQAPVFPPKPKYPPCRTLYDGFYGGLGAGYDAYQVNENTNFTFNGLPFGGNPPVSAMGLIAEAFGGYGIYLKDVIYLGGELLANSSAASATVTNTNSSGVYVYTTKFTVNTGYGLSLLPGYKLSDSSLLYVRLGYLWTSLKGQESVVVNGVANNTSVSGWRGGYNFGLGIETAMVDRFSLRGEYSYTSYQSFTSPFGTQFSPSNNQVMLSVIYHSPFLF